MKLEKKPKKEESEIQLKIRALLERAVFGSHFFGLWECKVD